MSEKQTASDYVAPLLLAVVAFCMGLGGDFVLDDAHAIVNNEAVNGSASIVGVFTHTFWGTPLDSPPPSYRPLTSLLFAIDYFVFRGSALGFHISSLVAYLLLVGLTQKFATRFVSTNAATVAACGFACMPLHAENVASLVGRADVLALIFSIACLSKLRYHGNDTSRRSTALSALLLTAALLCKESAVTIPGCALALQLWTCQGAFRQRLAASSPSFVLLGVALLYAWFRLELIPSNFDDNLISDDVLVGQPMLTRIHFGIENLAHYVRMALAPVDLCTGRKFAHVALSRSTFTQEFVFGILLVGLVVWRSISNYRQHTAPLVLCAFACWSIYSNIVFSVPEAMADRFMLAPSLFLILAIAPAIAKTLAKRPKVRIGWWAWLTFQVAWSAFYASRWTDNHTLMAHAVQACPNGVYNRIRHAHGLAETQQYTEAVWHFAVASQYRSAFPYSWEHPSPDAAYELTADDRARRVHELLEIKIPEAKWRAGFARYLMSLRLPKVAQAVIQTSPVPVP